jgi:phenylalanyl-tRNA synthetase alpha chain
MADSAHIGLILTALSSASSVSSAKLATEKKVDHNELVGAGKSLEAASYITAEATRENVLSVTPGGQAVIDAGSTPEIEFVRAVAAAGSLAKADTKGKAGLGLALAGGLVAWNDDKSAVKVTEVGTKAAKENVLWTSLKEETYASDEAMAKTLVKRKFLKAAQRTVFVWTRGPEYAEKYVKPVQDITAASLASGAWQTDRVRPYNFASLGVRPPAGGLHPLAKAVTEFRRLFIEMGFTEQPTNQWLESSFWNFDALFQPQQHPARDSHDTFFVKHPAACTRWPEEYGERVREYHESGNADSIGYRMDWDPSEARKNILRTHTTAVSARVLYELANQPGGFKPVKRFSIDRVFRNETTDATHLAEFHQIEGFVADYDLTVGDLIGILQQFYEKQNMTKLKFVPAFNPYTCPSLEVHGYSEALGRYVEIGNSGVFRPEMLLPMGFPPGVRVVAFGLGVERQVMMKFGLSNIRALVGHKLDLDFVKNNPICRLDN